MKFKVRTGTFETNSSSIHSLSYSDTEELKSLLKDIENAVDSSDFSELYYMLGKVRMLEQAIIRIIKEGE